MEFACVFICERLTDGRFRCNMGSDVGWTVLFTFILALYCGDWCPSTSPDSYLLVVLCNHLPVWLCLLELSY